MIELVTAALEDQLVDALCFKREQQHRTLITEDIARFTLNEVISSTQLMERN